MKDVVNPIGAFYKQEELVAYRGSSEYIQGQHIQLGTFYYTKFFIIKILYSYLMMEVLSAPHAALRIRIHFPYGHSTTLSIFAIYISV